MKTAAVIAEYNPFHNGHQYQLEQIRHQTGCDFILVLMSGHFIQRGIPALTDTALRAQMALEGGADVVLQLPVLYSTASAPDFAHGAIAILDHLGCIDTLAYGMEGITDANDYRDLIKLLTNEPKSYQSALKASVAKGNSFPFAIEEAAFQTFCETHTCARSDFHTLFSPNHILGVEYEKALKKNGSEISSLPLTRIGNGYHEQTTDSPFASASAIRSAIKNDMAAQPFLKPQEQKTGASFLNAVRHCMPASTFSILERHFQTIPPLFEDDFSSMLSYAIITNLSEQSNISNCSLDLCRRILKNRHLFQSFTQFAALLKTKNLTYSLICRCLCHILLNITQEDCQFAKNNENSLYARLLAFKKNAAPLLHQMRCHSSIPVITKLADAKNKLPDEALRILNLDLRAAEIYHSMEQTKSQRKIATEYQRSPVILL